MEGKNMDTEKAKWMELLQRMLDRATAQQVKDLYILALHMKY